MIINIKNKNDLITMDLRIKQIRYLRNFKNNHNVIFDSINLSNNDIKGYTYLFQVDKRLFLKTLIEDLKNNGLGIKINIKDLEVLK